MRNRAGNSLFELMAIIAVVMPVAALSIELALRIGKGPHSDDGQVAALVCLQMRRDAAAGAVADGDALALGGHHWQAVNGWWCRDGVQRLRIDDATWTSVGALVSLHLHPHQLPVRTLELEATP